MSQRTWATQPNVQRKRLTHDTRNGGDAQQSTKTHGDTSGAGERSVESRWGRDGNASDGRCDDEVTQPRNEKETEAPPGDTVRPTPLSTRRQQRKTHATSARTAKEIITPADERKRTRQNVNESEQMEATASMIMRVVEGGGRTKRNEFNQQTTDEDCSVIYLETHTPPPQTAHGQWREGVRTATIGTDTARGEQEN